MTKLRLFLIATFLALWPASASAVAPIPPGADIAPIVDTSDHALVLTPVLVTVLSGVVMPILLAIIFRIANLLDDRARAVAGVVAAFLVALVARATLADGSAVFDRALVLDVGLVYVPQLMTHLGFWKPTLITGSHGRIEASGHRPVPPRG